MLKKARLFFRAFRNGFELAQFEGGTPLEKENQKNKRRKHKFIDFHFIPSRKP